MNPPLPVRVVAALQVDGAPFSAASGLVRCGDELHVIADDELHLAVFDLQGGAGRRVRLIDGELPPGPAARKAVKPDFESLIAWPDGRLLALGSGSRPNRCGGVWIDPSGRAAPERVDLSAWFEALRREVGEPNVEGGFVVGDELRLLQRGNTAGGVNACVSFELAGLARGEAPLLRGVRRYDLGHREGVPLGFTDAAVLPDGRWLFSAAAEATRDAYLDGACAGSAIGLVERDGRLRGLRPLDGSWKVEGLHALPLQDGAIALTMVTDADDPAQAASLLFARWMPP